MTFNIIKKRVSSIDGIVALIILTNFFIYFALLIYSYYNFFSFNEYDKGIIYQMYYNTIVNGDFFYSSVLDGSGLYFRYILVLFLPFMYLYPNPPITFSLISTLILALGALPVYWLATDVVKSKRIGLLFVGLYFLYPAIGWFFLGSVKEEIFVLPFLLFAFYYMHIRSYSKFMIFLFLAVICKQNIFLVLPMFGLYAYLEKFDKKWIAGPVILSAGWFLTLMIIIKPFINSLSKNLNNNSVVFEKVILSSNGVDGTSLMSSFSSMTMGRYSWIGSNFSEISNNLITNPSLFIEHLGTSENIVYLILLFIPFCGISLLKPKVLMIGIPVFLQNLLATSPNMKMITWHYSSALVFVVITSAILAFPCIYLKINDKQKKLFVAILLIVSATSFFAFGPVIETVNNIHNMKADTNRVNVQFCVLGIQQENKDAFNAVLYEIPSNATILTTYNFGPYLYKNANFYYFDWWEPYEQPFPEDYDYYLFKRSILWDSAYFEHFQNVSQRSDIYVKYDDGENLVLGTRKSDLDKKMGDGTN